MHHPSLDPDRLAATPLAPTALLRKHQPTQRRPFVRFSVHGYLRRSATPLTLSHGLAHAAGHLCPVGRRSPGIRALLLGVL